MAQVAAGGRRRRRRDLPSGSYRAPVVFAALMICLLFAGAPVRATTVDECQSKIELARTMLEGTEIRGNHPDRTRASLESKLDGASIKLGEGKFCDAILKLDQFKERVLDLAVPNAKGETKIDPLDADDLAGQADDAIDCVRDLDPTCP